MALASLNDPHIQALTQHLGRPIPGGSEEVRFCSPFRKEGSNRRDTKYHLYVNPQKGKYFCFRSNEYGSLSYLFKLLGEEYTDKVKVTPPMEGLKERASSLGGLSEFEQPRTGLPEEYQTIVSGSVAHNYLVERGVSQEDIEYYRLGEGRAATDLTDWVIIPSFDQHNRCDYWVARRTNSDWGPKYTNPPSSRRYHVPFLHTSLSNSQDGSVILCEGVFSALVAGRDAVASLGKFVSKNQIAYMRKAGVRKVKLALDGDAWKESIDTAGRCLRMGLQASLVRLPADQDPADLGRSQFRALLGNEIEVTEVTLMRLRLGRL